MNDWREVAGQAVGILVPVLLLGLYVWLDRRRQRARWRRMAEDVSARRRG